MHKNPGLFKSVKATPEQEAARVAELEAEIAELQKTLGEGVDADAVVKEHIKLLHDYNETKDAAQTIIGRLAEHKETGLKQLHEEFGLFPEDCI